MKWRPCFDSASVSASDFLFVYEGTSVETSLRYLAFIVCFVLLYPSSLFLFLFIFILGFFCCCCSLPMNEREKWRTTLCSMKPGNQFFDDRRGRGEGGKEEEDSLFYQRQYATNRLDGGAGIAPWLDRRTRDRKVAGSNPDRSGGTIFSPGSTFCADSYVGIHSTPVLPQ